MKKVQIDSSQLDINLSEGKKILGRPFLISVVDPETQKIVGFHLSLTPPTGTAVLFAIENARSKGFQLPKTILVDNAKEFDGHELRAFCLKHGIHLEHVRPYKVASLSNHEKFLAITARAGKTAVKRAKKSTDAKAEAQRRWECIQPLLNAGNVPKSAEVKKRAKIYGYSTPDVYRWLALISKTKGPVSAKVRRLLPGKDTKSLKL